ncbi:MAG: protein-L-isoaspartate O-methyltransferase [Alphaproteobacteria bacterium]|nr:protein-L-isoaspartate O-methyltransferase [Alphaproteobacteria bacterium]
MFNFSIARKNMVNCQIRPVGVIMPELLQAFETVPREEFVPEKIKNIAYSDKSLSIGDGRFLLTPLTHARMVQSVKPEITDIVLDIGGVTGYSAAIFSHLVTTVIALEEKKKNIDLASKLWNELDICNVAGFKGKLEKGKAEHGTYNIIFMNGAVIDIQDNLIKQLSIGGRLIAIVRKEKEVMGKVTLVQKIEENNFSSSVLFEAASSYLPGFEPNQTFHF